MVVRRALGIGLLAVPLAWPAHRAEPTRAALDFRYDVLPILQRQGCASAYCHGAATGQGGFKLSLFGSDPERDHAAIALALGGRRLDLRNPAASLLLEKPTLALRHGGGRRLRAGEPAYQRLHDWITSGAPLASDPPRQLEALHMTRDGARLRVLAQFAGEAAARDVTELATFTSSDEAIVGVADDGTVHRHAPGEAWLFARYAGADARLADVQPFAALTTPTQPDQPLDAALESRAHALGVAPAALASPPRLARRLYLDLAGRPPTTYELRRFLALPETNRVSTTVEQLLASAEFAATLQRQLGAWLELPPLDDTAPGNRARTARLHEAVARFVQRDAPVHELTATLLAPGGEFLSRHEDPRDRAELFGRTMLGMRIGCARCHDHPHDRWRQRDHLAFAAHFVDPRPAPGGGMTAGVLFGDDGAAVAPRLLPLGEASTRGVSARDLHAFAHDRSHDAFARALCNRLFAWLFGRGLVEPVDDHRATNPAVHEAWLAALQATFHGSEGRLRALVRAIATSQAYQLDSSADAGTDPRARWMLARTPKPLGSDALRRAIAAVCGVPDTALPILPSSPLARRLALLNGDLLPRALDGRGNALETLATLGGSLQEQRDELFAACLSRSPSDAERALYQTASLRELATALLLSREFEFQR